MWALALAVLCVHSVIAIKHGGPVAVPDIPSYLHHALAEGLERFKNADIVWCQEEPRNNGSWFFVQERIENVLKEIGHKELRVNYAGRPEAAAPATGLMSKHLEQQSRLIDEALTVPTSKSRVRRTSMNTGRQKASAHMPPQRRGPKPKGHANPAVNKTKTRNKK